MLGSNTAPHPAGPALVFIKDTTTVSEFTVGKKNGYLILPVEGERMFCAQE